MGLLVAVFIGCGPGGDAGEGRPGVTTQPIMNGTFDPGDPATVLLGGGGGWSTGALVSPRVILTCGHCVDPQGEPRRFAYFGSSYLDGGTLVAVERSYPHPQYVSGAYPNIDIGIVILEKPVPPEVKPVGIQMAPLDGGVVGAPLRIVGFGATSPAMPEFSKMQVTVPVTGIEENYLLVGPAICAGDSGGPGLLGAGQGREVIAGVVSWHTVNAQGCGGNGGLARVDTQARWIQAQIDAAEDGGVGDAPPDGGPDAGGAPDGGSPAGADGGGGDGGTVPSDGPPDARDLAISGGCTAAGAGGGGPLLGLVLLTLLLETRARSARGGRRAPIR
jgi:V8-like Glu-specific endopeptidase